MNILLSIQQIYVGRIFTGIKKFEYRKRIWDTEVSWVYLYAGRPTKMIVGRFRYTGAVRGDKYAVWQATHEVSGITALDFFDYYAGRNNAIAIIVEDVEQFILPIDPYLTWPGYRAVQSWCYLDSEREDYIMQMQQLFRRREEI
jgi:predicted transcriptional regulator